MSLEQQSEKANLFGLRIFKFKKDLAEYFNVHSVEECKTVLAFANYYFVKRQNNSIVGKALIKESIEWLIKNPSTPLNSDVLNFWQSFLKGEYQPQPEDLPLYF